MLMGMKVTSDGFKRRQKSLGASWEFEASHSSFSGSGWAMRILRPIVHPPVLPMFNVGHQLLLRCSIAPHLVGDHDPRGNKVLHGEINHLTLSIHRSAQVNLLSLDDVTGQISFMRKIFDIPA